MKDMTREIKTATKKYNSIMDDLGYEHNTIGTSLSEDTEGWNLRDMVAEMDYTLGTFYESGHCNEEMRYGSDEEKKYWRSCVGKMSRFIKHYAPLAKEMRCTSGHCSKFDTK